MNRRSAAKPQTLLSVTEMIFDRCGRDSNKAVAELATKILSSPTFINEAAFIAARSLVGNIMAADRAKIFAGGDVPYPANMNQPGGEPPYRAPVTTIAHQDMPSFQTQAARDASAQRLRSATINGLFGLTFKSDNGDVTLGLATPEQLRPIAARYIATGTTSVQRGRFLERVCAAAKDGVPVSVSLTHKQVEAMKADADKIAV